MKAQFRYNKTIKTFVWLPSKTFASKYEDVRKREERERENCARVCVEILRTTFVKRNIIPFDVLRIERCRVARASMPRKQYWSSRCITAVAPQKMAENTGLQRSCPNSMLLLVTSIYDNFFFQLFNRAEITQINSSPSLYSYKHIYISVFSISVLFLISHHPSLPRFLVLSFIHEGIEVFSLLGRLSSPVLSSPSINSPYLSLSLGYRQIFNERARVALNDRARYRLDYRRFTLGRQPHRRFRPGSSLWPGAVSQSPVAKVLIGIVPKVSTPLSVIRPNRNCRRRRRRI